ncbi:MAG TPA: hypothetical protein VFQ45_04960 [Longimicrobium sp.]|nr:hypothetical protein [Longimicrobium sp.]
MTHASLKIRQVGGSAGLILPKEVLDELHAGIGDTLHLVRTDRGYELTPYDPAFREAMEGFEVIRRKHRNAFRELAK